MKMFKIKFNYFLKILFIILVIVGIYISINFVKIFSKNSVKIYEVLPGEIVNVDRHRGIIYRDEYVETCNSDGYINFFVANARKVNRGSFIYSISDTKNEFDGFELNNNDINEIKKDIKIYINNINNIDFSTVYQYKENIDNLIYELNIVKQLENIDFEKELIAKEKGYAKYAGLISFFIDGFEKENMNNYEDSLIREYTVRKVSSQKNIVNTHDKIYKIVRNPEFSIVFDSDYDYDLDKNHQNVKVKFVYDNITANARIESFISNDNKKHFILNIVDYPERFLEKRVVDFEIENKKISGYKIPIRAIVSKNCYKIPKTMIEKDEISGEDFSYIVSSYGDKRKVLCNISKEDKEYYYISIDDNLSSFKYGDVLINRYGDTFSLSVVEKLNGVYNMNKGYAIFKNIDIVDKTNEFAIIKKGTINGISLYDHIALNADDINEGDFIS